MKKDNSAPIQAHEFESIQAADVMMGDTRCVNVRLYSLPGKSGVFRRVARTGKSLKPKGDIVRAYYGGALIQLVEDKGIRAELAEAGLFAPGPTSNEVPKDLETPRFNNLPDAQMQPPPPEPVVCPPVLLTPEREEVILQSVQDAPGGPEGPDDEQAVEEPLEEIVAREDRKR